MKISYRSRPVIDFIKAGSLDNASFFDDDYDEIMKVRNNIKYEWEQNANLFANNIKILTKPFINAVEKAHDKLCNAKLPEYQSGTFIYDKYAYCYAYNTYNYTTWELVIFEFYESNLIYYQSMTVDKEVVFFISGVFKKELFDNTNINDTQYIAIKADHLFSIINFIKYADIDIKIVPATQKKKYDKQKYVNDTKYNVEVMDTTWFTESIRTEGFPVEGHFRMQPFGQGMQERKLIWIHDFEKHGYVRRAKKLKEESVYDM